MACTRGTGPTPYTATAYCQVSNIVTGQCVHTVTSLYQASTVLITEEIVKVSMTNNTEFNLPCVLITNTVFGWLVHIALSRVGAGHRVTDNFFKPNILPPYVKLVQNSYICQWSKVITYVNFKGPLKIKDWKLQSQSWISIQLVHDSFVIIFCNYGRLPTWAKCIHSSISSVV